jgi:3-oxoacyl-[acyl-carrier-protein] synthase-3
MIKLPYRSRILGTGSYLPEELITNQYLSTLVETSDQWIQERTGIRVRHKASANQATSDLAFIAAQQALEEAKISPKDLDMILFATVSPDQVMPNTACVLQHRLKAGDCMALDISAACSGFVYGLSIADQFIKSGPTKNVLVIGAEVLTHYVDYKDRDTCILFGDGAGAAVVGRAKESEDSHFFSHHLHADGDIGGAFMAIAVFDGGLNATLADLVNNGNLVAV